MRLTYSPEGATPQTWDYDPAKLLSSEAIAIEKATGMEFDGEYQASLLKGSIAARRALLWVLLKRGEPTLKFEQIDPPTGAMALEYTRPELVDLREKVLSSPLIEDADRYPVLEAIDQQLAEMEPVDEAPKAPAESVSGESV